MKRYMDTKQLRASSGGWISREGPSWNVVRKRRGSAWLGTSSSLPLPKANETRNTQQKQEVLCCLDLSGWAGRVHHPPGPPSTQKGGMKRENPLVNCQHFSRPMEDTDVAMKWSVEIMQYLPIIWTENREQIKTPTVQLYKTGKSYHSQPQLFYYKRDQSHHRSTCPWPSFNNCHKYFSREEENTKMLTLQQKSFFLLLVKDFFPEEALSTGLLMVHP